MIMDLLNERVLQRGPVCVGLDTSLEYIPKSFLKEQSSIEDAIFNYNKALIDEIGDNAGCYKVQIAFYECYGLQGLKAYAKTTKYLRQHGHLVIGDVKRGDISSTAQRYAEAHFTGDFEVDIITLNPYMGMDSIEPYLPYIKDKEKGIFALLRTSNSGARDIQFLDTPEGKVYETVGEKLKNIGGAYIGDSGYSSIGAVVGCCSEAKELRQHFREMFFLVPGYGAQGGGAEEAADCFISGSGAVVNSSRGILLAYRKEEEGYKNFAQYALKEVIDMKQSIKAALYK